MAEAKGSSLSQTFKQVNHYRHILMDVAMFSSAIAAVVATGGAFGLLDPVGIFLNMHIPAMSDLGAIGTFLSEGYANAASGVLFTDAAAGVSVSHAAHAASSAAAVSTAAEAAHAGHEMVTSGAPMLSEAGMALLGITP